MNLLKTLADRYYAADDVARKPAHYLKTYDDLFSPFREQQLRILELGVHRAASMHVWSEYFPASEVVGLDINPKPADFPDSERIHYVQGSQSDERILCHATEFGPFDIIIDDAAHIGELAKASFVYLFPDHLKQGGLYVLEDWGVALTNPKWPDASPNEEQKDCKNHLPSFDFGMVGLVKQLVDEMLLRRIDETRMDVGPIHLQPGIAVIEKKRAGVASKVVLSRQP